MAANVCAICLAERSDDQRHPLFTFPGRIWARIGGVEVCPDCQAPEEAQEVWRRFQTRMSQFAEDGDDRPEVTNHDPASARLTDLAMPAAAITRMRVEMTGAFSTGRPLVVDLAEYDETRAALQQVLAGVGWSTRPPESAGGSYTTGGGFAEKTPLVLATRKGTDLPHLDEVRAALEEDFAPRGLHARLADVEMEIYDLGVAVVTARLAVRSSQAHHQEAIAKAMTEVADLGSQADAPAPALGRAMRRLAASSASDFRLAVETAFGTSRSTPWHSAGSETPSERPKEIGRLLWLHPVCIMTTPLPPTKHEIRSLAPAFHRVLALDDEARFAPGVGRSAIWTTSTVRAAEMPLRLTLLHWAYYALYMTTDRDLMSILNQTRWSEAASLRSLERDSESVALDHLRVTTARSRLDTELNSLGGDEAEVWAKIAEVQHFDVVVEAVDRKLEALDELSEQRLARANNSRGRLISNSLGFLSFLVLLSLAIAVLGATKGSLVPHLQSADLAWRWITVALASSVVGYVTVFWLSLTRPRRTRRAPRH